VANTIGNQRIVVGPLQELDLSQFKAGRASISSGPQQSSSIEGYDSLLKLTLRKPINTFD
jgi:hypothetical protein